MGSLSAQELRRPRRQLSPPFALLSEDGEVLLYALESGRGWLGGLERAALKELAGGPAILADLARILGRRRQTVHEALQRLEGKGLVISSRAAGQALHGTPVLRRLYTLNPEACLEAHPVQTFTLEDLREEAQQAQLRGVLRQRLWEATAKLGSPRLETRAHGRRLLEQVRDDAQAALDAEALRLTRGRRHPTTA